jgi:hypothetical protein
MVLIRSLAYLIVEWWELILGEFILGEFILGEIILGELILGEFMMISLVYCKISDK